MYLTTTEEINFENQAFEGLVSLSRIEKGMMVPLNYHTYRCIFIYHWQYHCERMSEIIK